MTMITGELRRRNTEPYVLLANDRLKWSCGANGLVPQRGHHQATEMFGLWLHPYKILDSLTLELRQEGRFSQRHLLQADAFTFAFAENQYRYDNSLSHSQLEVLRRDFIPGEGTGLAIAWEIRNTSPEAATSLEWALTLGVDVRPVWDPAIEDARLRSRYHVDLNEAARRFSLAATNAFMPEGEVVCLMGSLSLPWAELEQVPQAELDLSPHYGYGEGRVMRFRGKVDLAPGETKVLRLNLAAEVAKAEGAEERAAAEPAHQPPQHLEDAFEALAAMSFEALRESRMDYLAPRLGRSLWRDLEERGARDVAYGEAGVAPSLGSLRQTLPYLRYGTSQLYQRVPGHGAGLTAGQPEYPWWFGCDNYYSVQALLASGQFEMAKATIELLLHYAERNEPAWKVPHEITTAGKIVHPGNVQEQGLVITLVREYLKYTGDLDFLRRHFDGLRGVYELMDEMAEGGRAFPKGYGITEIAGLNLRMIDSTSYTIEAYDAMADLAELMGEGHEALARQSRAAAEDLKAKLHAEFWLPEEGLFGDCFATGEELRPQIPRIMADIERHASNERTARLKDHLKAALEGDEEQGQAWLLNENWVIWTPFETGIAGEEEAESAFAQFFSGAFVGDWGVYLDAVSRAQTMTISTGVLVKALCRYHYYEDAVRLLLILQRNFSRVSPGTWHEMSPDYGCFVQAWTAYGYEEGIVRGLWGLEPDAPNRRLNLSPGPARFLLGTELQDVRFMDGSLSLSCVMEIDVPVLYIDKRFAGELCVGEEVIEGEGRFALPWPECEERFIEERFIPE